MADLFDPEALPDHDGRLAGGDLPGDHLKGREDRALSKHDDRQAFGSEGFRPLNVTREIVQEDRFDVVFIRRSLRRRGAGTPRAGKGRP